MLGILVAWVIRQTGRYKRLALYALPLRVLGTLAIIPAVRDPRGTNTRALVLCQCCNALAGAVHVICNTAAVNAAVVHSDLAIVLAVLMLFSSVGSSVGTAVAGAVWTSSMPKLLHEFLPDGQKHLAEELYGSLKRQLERPRGDPVREAVVRAYCVTETRLCVIAAASLPFLVVCLMMWRDLPVRDEDEGGAAAGRDKWKGDGTVEHHD